MAKPRKAGSTGRAAKARRPGRAARAASGSKGGAQATGRAKLPWWLPGAVFVLATLALFGEFVFSDRMLYGEDSLSLGYMARAYFAERLTAGDFPLWSPRLLGGIPFVEALAAGDSIYPASLLYFLVEPYRALGWKLVLHVLAGGFFMYGWTRSLGMHRAAATLGGLAWLMAPVVVTLVLPGNDGKLMVASLAPLVFWATETVFRRPSARSAAALAGAVALACLTTQFQTAYFLFLTTGAYAVFRAVRPGDLASARGHAGADGPSARRPAFMRLGLFLAGSVLGAGVAAVQLVPAFQYVNESSRRIATTVEATPEEALAYSSSWSLHPEEIVSLAVPEFVGSTAAEAPWGRGTYWGRNALKLNHEYLGVTVLALALLALFGRRRRGVRWFMAAAAGVWLLFALGAHTPVWRIFYEAVPGISLFRAPSLAAFLVSFAATTLFAFGVDDLVRAPPQADAFLASRRGRALLAFLGLLLLGLLAQASGLLGRAWTTTIHPGAGSGRLAAFEALAPFATRGFAAALVLAAAAAGVAWALAERRVPAQAALAVLAVAVAVDLGRIDRAFIRTDFDFERWAAPDANVRFLLDRRASEPPFRVADLRGDDQNVKLAMFGLDLTTGHHPNDLARYRRLLGLEASRRRGANTANATVLRLLNVKYLVWPIEARGPLSGGQVLSTAPGPSGTEAVYAFPGLGRAWMVDTMAVMDDDDALARILSPDFDPEREALVAPPGPAVQPNGGGTATWDAYEPDHRRLTVRATGPGLLVISENWFPGWTAEVNGEESPVHRVNVTLQAVEIPGPGEHSVVLRFTAPTVGRALRWTAASAVIVASMLAASVLPARVRAKLLPRRRRGDSS